MTSTDSGSTNAIPTDGPPGGMVVGIDGSATSLHALAWAARRTGRFGPIQPVIAWHYPWWSYIGPAVPQSGPFEDAAREEVEHAIGSVHSEGMGEPIIVRARAASTLVDIGRSAGLIVVGSHGRSGWVDGLLGSVAAAVVARSPVPVAVVPPAAPIDDQHRRVVVGLDGSPNSVSAMQWATDNVPVTSTIEAVHVWSSRGPVPSATDADHDGPEARARSVLDQSLSAVVQTAPVAPPVRARLVQGDPRAVLRERSKKSDMLILGARGRGGLSHLVLGSVTTALVQRPQVTTVVIPAG